MTNISQIKIDPEVGERLTRSANQAFVGLQRHLNEVAQKAIPALNRIARDLTKNIRLPASQLRIPRTVAPNAKQK